MRDFAIMGQVRSGHDERRKEVPEKMDMSRKKRPLKRPPDLVEAIICEQRRHDPTDVLGSWTGVPWDENDEPVQDADDL